MKELMKPALGMFGKQIVVNLMNIFMCISFMVLATGLLTKVDGYDATVYKDGSNDPIAQYTYKEADGEDAKKAEYEAQGYKVMTRNTRAPLTNGQQQGYFVVVQIVAIILVSGFVYPEMWSIGAKDSNLVKFKHKKEDKLKGLKIGAIAMIPYFVLMLAILTVGRNIFNVPLTAIIFANFYSFIQWIGGSVLMVKDLALWQSVLMFLPLFIVPFIAWLGYYLGYKDISVSEKIIYKNKNKKVGE